MENRKQKNALINLLILVCNEWQICRLTQKSVDKHANIG